MLPFPSAPTRARTAPACAPLGRSGLARPARRAPRVRLALLALATLVLLVPAQTLRAATIHWEPGTEVSLDMRLDPYLFGAFDPDAFDFTDLAPRRDIALPLAVPAPDDLPTRYGDMATRNNPDLCVAVTLYHEARGESLRGQRAVASVILTRARVRGRWGDTICDVVHPTQFTFYHGASCLSGGTCTLPAVDDPAAWARAVRLTREMRAAGPLDALDGADHYHSHAVSPDWADAMPRVATIGNHVFYADPLSRGRMIAHVSAKTPDTGPRPGPRSAMASHTAPRPAPRPGA